MIFVLFLWLKKQRGHVKLKARGFIRGGNWDNGANDGVFTLNLNNAPSNTNTNIGFRCARFSGLKTNWPEFHFLRKMGVSRINPRHNPSKLSF